MHLSSLILAGAILRLLPISSPGRPAHSEMKPKSVNCKTEPQQNK